MRTAVVYISDDSFFISFILKLKFGDELESISRDSVGERFHDFDAFIFVGAVGICVRTIAPYIENKHTDPAVICMDSLGKNVVSILSGHEGGANKLAKDVAAALGATPIITTLSDIKELWPLDTIGEDYGWRTKFFVESNLTISLFVHESSTALLMDIRDEGTLYLEQTLPKHVKIVKSIEEIRRGSFSVVIIVSPFEYPLPKEYAKVQYYPPVLDLGVGLAKDAPTKVWRDIKKVLAEHRIDLSAGGIGSISTIDIKARERALDKLCERTDAFVEVYSAEDLAKVKVPNPSETVEQLVGTPSVCEASALITSCYGDLIVPKIKGENFTVAVAMNKVFKRGGHIEIVGAGPGDPDLISVRGRNLLEHADFILYAGSLVPEKVISCAKKGAVVLSSANMTLEEQCMMMKEYYDQDKQIVRLHTGDPCIFGAIEEQMAFFDKHDMHYHITPGISSFQAAAAELRSQFTIPEQCQTIILTRGEGRTPMPEREKLHLLARSRSTMCIFLSAAIVDDVQRELLMEYPEETPVAVCYHLTWDDQKVFRGQLKDLAQIVHDHDLTLTTMIVVGDAIDNREYRSKLYDSHFSHLFRDEQSEGV